MYLIGKDQPLTLDYLGRVLAQFQTKDRPRLQKLKDYYAAKQDIMLRQPTDVGKFNSKVCCNYAYAITNTYNGYITGKPVTYEGNDIDSLINVLNYNDDETECSVYLKDALVNGVAYEICYLDEQGQVRYRTLDPRECVPIYDDTITNELAYVVRFYREDLLDRSNEDYIVEVYSEGPTQIYRSAPGFSSFTLIKELPNYFNMCPITVFDLNEDNEGIFEQIISLQDSYNMLISSEQDEYMSFADAYLVLKGVQADEKDLNSAKQRRCLMMDTECSAEYLTKDIADTQIEHMLSNLNDKIYAITQCPDFSDERWSAQSGIALKLKLVGFENRSSNIEKQMRKALQRRIELICKIINIKGGDMAFRDIEIKFNRNLPTDLVDSANIANALRGLVSNETLLGLLPFVKDVDEELAKVAAEKAQSMELYQNSFVSNNSESEPNEE